MNGLRQPGRQTFGVKRTGTGVQKSHVQLFRSSESRVRERAWMWRAELISPSCGCARDGHAERSHPRLHRMHVTSLSSASHSAIRRSRGSDRTPQPLPSRAFLVNCSPMPSSPPPSSLPSLCLVSFRCSHRALAVPWTRNGASVSHCSSSESEMSRGFDPLCFITR